MTENHDLGVFCFYYSRICRGHNFTCERVRLGAIGLFELIIHELRGAVLAWRKQYNTNLTGPRWDE